MQRVRHKNGSYIWFEVIYNWVAGGTDGHPHILTVGRDITERKAAEDVTARLQALLTDAVSAIDDGIAIYDLQERLIVANAAMRQLAGGPADLLEPGRTFTEVVDHVRTGYSHMDEKTFAAFHSWRTAQFRAADGIPHEQLLADGNWILLKDFRALKQELIALETRQQALQQAIANAVSPPPLIHPNPWSTGIA
jgi:PAS domain-containing protein